MHHQVADEGEPGVEVPPVKRHGERELDRCAAAPVQDARQKDVQRDEEEQEVREGKTDQLLGPDEPGGHASEGPAALEQVYTQQRHKHQTDIDVEGQHARAAIAGCPVPPWPKTGARDGPPDGIAWATWADDRPAGRLVRRPAARLRLATRPDTPANYAVWTPGVRTGIFR
jgi:hypothetical protein